MGSSRSTLRSALVVSEVTIALVLLVGAALMVSTFRRMLTISPGYETRNLLKMEVALPSLNYGDDARTTAYYDRALHELSGIRGVRDAGAAGYMPAAEGVFIEGRPEARPGEPVPGIQAVSDRYLQALGLPLEHGRFPSAQDRPEAPRVVVVSESIARYYWPNQQGGDAIGRRIRLAGGTAPWLTVVGVVGDVRDWFTHNPLPRAYVPSAQAPRRAMQVVMRTNVDPMGIVPAVRASMHAVDASQPIYDLMSMEQAISEQTSGVRVSAATMTIYAGIALLLSITGIYAVVAYSVVQRTHEIGIRMALGAGSGEILKMTVGFALRIAAMGLAVGLPLSFLLMQFVSRVLYGVVVVDTLTLATFTLVLAVAAGAAGYIPARQATRVDPLTALRAD